MASPLEVKQASNCNLAIKELEKGCKLTAMLQAHLGIVLKDNTNSKFGYLFEEISRTLAFSRETLVKSNQNFPEYKVLMPQASDGARNKKRRRDCEFKDCHTRKHNNRRTQLTLQPDHDGYQWRKYGQKNILYKTYPRCYYRCTYHSDRNCMAAKQVQQYNDEYPPLFEVTYFDQHTCEIAIFNFKSTNSQNMLNFYGKSIPGSNLSLNTMGYRREDEEATLVSCLTNVITGYKSGISENSNGVNKPQATSNESSVSIDDDKSSIETLREAEHPVVHDMDMDLEWLGQHDIKFLLEPLSPFGSML